MIIIPQIFDVSGGEFLVVLFFVVILFGSKSLPGLAKSFGKGIRDVKNATQDIQNEIMDTGKQIKKDIAEPIEQSYKKTTESLNEPFQEDENKNNDRKDSVPSNSISRSDSSHPKSSKKPVKHRKKEE